MDGGKRQISAEEVIATLKDDGDFDTLRLKIIRKLKEKEDLRNSIISAVKQSEAIVRPGAENLKPRQLSDAIHQEIGEKVMNQISDGLWAIIRSGDGMKNEITETVESVYNKLLKPKWVEMEEDLSLPNSQQSGEKEANGYLMNSPHIINNFSDSEPNEPPGFSLSSFKQEDDNQEHHKESAEHQPFGEELKREPQDPPDAPKSTINEKPAIDAAYVNSERQDEGIDEDPDVPPGFG